MSFVQQLGRNVVRAQQRHEIEWQQYEAETQRLLQLWVAEIKERFMAECIEASHKRHLSCTMVVGHPDRLAARGASGDLLLNQLWGILVELGFQDGSVAPFAERLVLRPDSSYCALLTGKWTSKDTTSTSPQQSPTHRGGTCATCPICHEHRPAVVLVPCGHVVCRECHGCQKLRQCPMCREVIASASRGLFMD